MKHFLMILLLVSIASAQTETRGASTQTGTYTNTAGINASAASVVRVSEGTTVPGSCTGGQLFVKTDASAGQNLYTCSGGTYTVIGGSGSAATAGYGISISGTAISYDPTDMRQKVLVDDFVAPVGTADSFSVGALHWRYGHGGTCTASLVSASNWEDFGQWEVTTGTTSGNGCWLNFQSGGYGPATQFYANTDKPWNLIWRVKVDATTNVILYAGLQGLYNGDPPGDKGFFFRYSTTASDTDFMLVSRASSTDTAVSMGVAANTSYNIFHLYSDGVTANKIYASVNGGTAKTICASGCDITTNISTTGNMQPFVANFINSTSARKMSVEKLVMPLITSTAAR